MWKLFIIKIMKKSTIHYIIEDFFLDNQKVNLVKIFDSVLFEDTIRARKFIKKS